MWAERPASSECRPPFPEGEMNRNRLCGVAILVVSISDAGLWADPPSTEEKAALVKDVADYSKECRKRVEKETDLADNYFRLGMGRMALDEPTETARYFRLAVAKNGLMYFDLLNLRRTDGEGSRPAYLEYLRDLRHDPVVEFYLLMALDADAAFADRGKKALRARGADAIPSLLDSLRLPDIYLSGDRVAVVKALLLASVPAALRQAEIHKARLTVESERVGREIQAMFLDGLAGGTIERYSLPRNGYLNAQHKLMIGLITELKAKK